MRIETKIGIVCNNEMEAEALKFSRIHSTLPIMTLTFYPIKYSAMT